jgi:NADH-quinone oxidoreductase subunit I
MGLVKRYWAGFWSLVVGLRVTGGHMLRRRVTLYYPHEKPDTAQWGGPIELVTFPETQTHDCIGCKACERICPSDCIDVEGKRPEGAKKMRATKFILDFSTCSLCGLCVDVCPTDTLQYSTRYDEAMYTRDATRNDLLRPYGEDPLFSGKAL